VVAVIDCGVGIVFDRSGVGTTDEDGAGDWVMARIGDFRKRKLAWLARDSAGGEMDKITTTDYKKLLGDIKERIRTAQYEALRAVNKELIALYWDIGKMIVERQKGKTWGQAVIKKLSQDTQREFPGMAGFSWRNLFYMRDFYLAYAENEKLQPMVATIGWTQNLLILEKCKDELQREFYIRMTRKFGWTKVVLIHHIENKTYEKTLLNQTNFDQTLSPELRQQAKLAVKDEYTFDFLELGDEFSERQLESALMSRMALFLQEMGGIFAFVGSQVRLEVGNKEFFLDILLFHRRLRCPVVLELKAGEFIPEYIGKLQFYLAVVNDTLRLPDENPVIGIILCKSKNKTIVEYSLRQSTSPIGVAEYQTVSTLPDELKGELPSAEQVAILMEGID
jgi:predicted nuclease of restriction endonuclease-like (RecB) superfamily